MTSRPEMVELCRSISVDLTESKRLSSLLLSSFQFSVQKLEPFLRGTEGFSLESFRAKGSSFSPYSVILQSSRKVSDLALETSVAEMKEYITKFSLERQSWDQLLLRYQEEAEEILSRGSAETKNTEVEVGPRMYVGSSQSEVLNTKPDYQKILQNQTKLFDCMELVVS
ncbi:DSN1 [Cervus elaphus hippelaphus]|uniref:DSN1 n=1 Tax=Cervus elaphus hippelaphus TaxID=46360 RepID=A0A212CBA2_CEREH|nr:DSN1 [Cervus elaphus hippelaphus]